VRCRRCPGRIRTAEERAGGIQPRVGGETALHRHLESGSVASRKGSAGRLSARLVRGLRDFRSGPNRAGGSCRGIVVGGETYFRSEYPSAPSFSRF
jgi:hypothetical protein